MKKERLDALNEKDIAIGLIVSDKYCREVIPVLNPKYIEIDYIRILSSWIKEYYLEFREAPKNNIIKLYRSKVDTLRDEALGDNILTLISNLEGKTNMNEGFMIDQSIKYLKKRSLQCLAEDIEACVSVNDIEKAEETLSNHRIVEKSGSDTVSVMHSLDKVIDSFDSEEEVLLRLPGAYGSVIGDIHREDFFAFIAPFKRGKCLSKGTKILMADGSIKEVQDIVVGDKLMGDDSTPRNVEIVSTGFGKMYRITSNVNSIRKDKTPEIDFTCNGNHILVLKNADKRYRKQIEFFRKDGRRNGEFTKGSKNNFLKQEEIEISVDDFLKLSKYEQSCFRLFRTFVNYPEKSHFVSPRLMGIWLGDGTSTSAHITTSDDEIINYCLSEAEKIGDKISVEKDKKRDTLSKLVRFTKDGIHACNFYKELKKLNLIGNKHIPNEYLADSRENRLELLAGIIDTDGWCIKDCNICSISLMNETLAKDVVKLCQQLGFRTKMAIKHKHYNGMYPKTNGWADSWNITITGKLSEIKTLLKRKQMNDSLKSNCVANTYKFTITPTKEDNYYGFVIDGNHRFLLADTTVSHNTFALMDLAVRGFFNGLKILFVSLEMGERAVVRRFWTSISGQISKDKENINYPKFVEKNGVWKIEERRINKKASDSDDIKKMSNFIRRVARNGDIRVLAVPSYSLRVDKLETKMEKMAYEDNFIPDLVVVDYADIMCPSEKNEYRQQLDSIWKRLRSMAQKWHCAVITASQTNRDALNGDATQENVAEDIRKIAHITSMVSINQTEEEKKKGVVRFKQLAIREEGAEYRQAVCLQCLDLGKMVIDSRFDDEVEDYLYSDDGDTYRRKKRRERNE